VGETFKTGMRVSRTMSREDQIYASVIIAIFVAAAVLLVVDTRPLWSREKLIQKGVLSEHYQLGGSYIFKFRNETPVAEKGWLWKTFLPTNRTVALYRRGGALVVKEVFNPSISR